MKVKLVKESLDEHWGMSDDYIDRLGNFERELFDEIRKLSDMEEGEFYDFVDFFSDEHRGMILSMMQKRLTPAEAAQKTLASKRIMNQFRSK